MNGSRGPTWATGLGRGRQWPRADPRLLPRPDAPAHPGPDDTTRPRGTWWAQLGRLVMTCERFALVAALGLWTADAVLLAVSRGGATWTQWAVGMGGAGFVALSTAIVVG